MGAGLLTARSDADEVLTAAQIAVCAPDETVRARIEAVLELAGHEVAVACNSTPELLDRARHADPALVVLAFAFEPFIPAADVELVRDELGGVPVVLVVSGFAGSPCRRLVRAGLEGLIQESEIEHALSPAVDAVLAGQLCLPASMRGTLAHPVFSHREK